jgi:hypothetical protein
MKKLLLLFIAILITSQICAEVIIDHLPYTINNSGIYKLGGDLTLSSNTWEAIEINADNVVLDGNGHKINGNNSCNYIISAWGRKNITITNIKVCNSSMSGIVVSMSEDVSMSNIEAYNMGNIGIVIFARHGYITDITVHDCSSMGVIVGGSYIQVSNIKSYNNYNYGLLVEGSYHNVSKIEVYNNKDGLALLMCSYSNFQNINTYNNNLNGIYIFQGSSHNTFTGVTTYGNGDYGVKISNGEYNTIYYYQIPEGWWNCGIPNNSGYKNNYFIAINPTKAPIPLPTIIIALITIPIIALRKLSN